jgi:hypothetical protein
LFINCEYCERKEYMERKVRLEWVRIWHIRLCKEWKGGFRIRTSDRAAKGAWV